MEKEIWKKLNKEAVSNYTELDRVTLNKAEAEAQWKASSTKKA